MQTFTTSMSLAASLTLNWVRAINPIETRLANSGAIRRTLEAYRLQPVSHNSALAPAEAESGE
jgi:hypothetical protein